MYSFWGIFSPRFQQQAFNFAPSTDRLRQSFLTVQLQLSKGSFPMLCLKAQHPTTYVFIPAGAIVLVVISSSRVK